jgi:hypothetical protein
MIILTYRVISLLFTPVTAIKSWVRTNVLTSDDGVLLRLYRQLRKKERRSHSLRSHRFRIFSYRVLLWLLLPNKRGAMLNVRKKIAFYPDLPSPSYAIFSICLFLNARMTQNIKDADLVVRWKDQSLYSLPEQIVSLLDVKKTINLKCDNIKKLYLDEVFHDVFGYSTRVDPLRHTGECVKKSDFNAKHDGQVINCPIEEVEPDFIYQLKLNNEVPGTSYVMDLRTYVFGDTIPYVRLTYKPKESRFGANFVDAEILDTSKVFTSDEVELILRLCRRMGLDYGELDIIRHRDDGKLFILDTNNTPAIRHINPCFDFDDGLKSCQAFYNAFLRDVKSPSSA